MGKILSTYERVEKTLVNATTSHKLTSGSLKENEIQTFSLRLWMDEDTPPLDEVMNASFLSKVVIKAFHKEDIDNTLVIESTSLNEEFSNQEEVISFTGRSEKYNIIEYSLDNVIWNPVDTPAKEVTVLQTYKEDGEYTMYFKDEVGNVMEKSVATLKLDQESPILNASAVEYLDGIKIDASKSSDSKSKIKNYYYRLGDGEYILSNTNIYTFTGLSDGNYTITIKIEDNAGNVTDEITKEVTVAYAQVYVSNSGNDTTGIGSINNPYATLQPAYNKVKSGGEIILLSDVTATGTTNMNIENKEVTLKSNGENRYSIFRGDELKTAVIDVSNANTLTMSNIILDGKNINANASLIECSFANLILNSETIIQNNKNSGRNYSISEFETSAYGGGLFIYHGSLNINGGIIKNNSVYYSAYSAGGGIFASYATINIISGEIINNEQKCDNCSNGGGGIILYDNYQGTTLEITGASITNNHAILSSGENILANKKVTVYIKGGPILNNTVVGINGSQIIDQR